MAKQDKATTKKFSGAARDSKSGKLKVPKKFDEKIEKALKFNPNKK